MVAKRLKYIAPNPGDKVIIGGVDLSDWVTEVSVTHSPTARHTTVVFMGAHVEHGDDGQSTFYVAEDADETRKEA